MAWDFSTDPEFQEKLDWVEQFCKEKVEPLDYVFPYAVRSPDPTVKALRPRASSSRSRTRACGRIFLDEELGGPGFGQLKLGLLNEIIGRYGSAPQMFGAAAPDTGNMEMLAAYGTEEQKKRWLEPLLNQEMFSAYSMTEPQGGSDPNLFKTHAIRDGDEWVINGEKWFTSAGRVADILFVMCTNGMFVVPRETPGRRDPAGAPQPQPHHLQRRAGAPRPPARPRGRRQGARPAAPRRRPHPPRHAHHRPVQAGLRHDVRAGAEPRVARQDHRRAPDGAGEDRRLLRRRSACCGCSCSRRRGRSTTPRTQEARTDIAAVKYTMAKVLREVSFNALHILGSLGTTDLTPIQAMYAGGARPWASPTASTRCTRPPSPAACSRSYRPHEGYWPDRVHPGQAGGGVEEDAAGARRRPRPRGSRPSGYKKYFAGRR